MNLRVTGQPFNLEKPVKVYKNLRKDCYSVMQSGLVVAHTDDISLINCQFIVQPAGTAKVRRTKVKGVHAWVKGTIGPELEWLKCPYRAVYNPYKHDTFMDSMTWKPVFFARTVFITSEYGVLYRP